MKKGAIAVAAAFALAAGVVGCSTDAAGGAAGGPITLRMANVTTSSAKEAGVKFAELVKEYSGGSIIVEHFPDNQLGDDKTAVEGTQIGDIDISVTSTSSVANVYSDYYLFDVPYLFLNSQEVYSIGFDSEAGAKVRDGVEGIGLKGLAMWENGFRNLTNNDIAAASPADVKGTKIRTMENEIHLAAWKAFGANPTPMAFSELFTALQQGTVDGQENPIGIILSNKFYEVQHFLSLTQHVYTPYAVLMNLEKYNSLTDAQKAAVSKAMTEATQFQLERSHEADEAALGTMREAGTEVVELSDEQKRAFQSIIEGSDVLTLAKGKMARPELLDEMVTALKATRA